MLFSVSSKLFLAGEYAITKPSGHAIILSIPKYTTAKILPANDYKIHSTLFDYSIDFTKSDKNYQLILDSINFVFDFLKESNIQPKIFHLEIDSELYHQKQKYGLGSSGAIVVLIFKTLLTYHQVIFDNLMLFKLCAIFLKRNGDNGSFGDIACIAFNQNIYYHNFDKTFIDKTTSILETLNSDFNSLKIEPFKFQFPIHLCVVWSQQPASSAKFINEIFVNETFVIKSNQIVSKLLSCDIATFKKEIENFRKLLQSLSNKIEIPALATICDNAKNTSLIAKSSGAGGGDCAIVFYENIAQKDAFKKINQFPIIMEVNYE